MGKAGKRILAGAKEAVAIAKGEQPAASMYVAGHRYYPAEDVRAAALIFYKWACEEIVVDECRHDRSAGCISCDTITSFERMAEILEIPELALPPA
jgi:hypothetical protein